MKKGYLMGIVLLLGLMLCTTASASSTCQHEWVYSGTGDSNMDTYHYKTCWVCHYEVLEEHNWEPASCTSKKRCTLCNHSVGQDLGGHTWTPNGDGTHTCTTLGGCGETKDCFGWQPTCTDASICVHCGFLLQNALGHTTESVTVGYEGHEATCSWPAGCGRCGKEFGDKDMNNHWEVINKAVPATCASTGLTEGWHCSLCNAITVKKEIVPATGHTEVTDKAVPATCTTDGKTEGKHCSVCHTVLAAQKSVAAKGHYVSYWSPVGEHTHEAACLRDGCNHAGKTRCTLYEVQMGEMQFSVCPVCGEWNGGVFEVLVGAGCEERKKGAIPHGELIVRGLPTPCGIVPVAIEGMDTPLVPLYGLTVAYEYAGRVEELRGLVRVSVPLGVDTPFTLVRLNLPTEEGDVWTEIPFDGGTDFLSFETDQAGLFLLLSGNQQQFDGQEIH